MKTVFLRIEGMHCDGCAETIKALLDVEAGVNMPMITWPDGHR